MICLKCGFYNPDDAVFCASCGSRTAPDTAREPEPVYSETDREYMGYTHYAPEKETRRNAYVRVGDSGRNWAAVTGFVMGIVSLVLAPIFGLLGVPGFVLSILGLRSEKRGLSVAGIVLSALGFLAGLVVLIVIAVSVIGLSLMSPGDMEFYIQEFYGLSALMLPFIR